MNFKRFQDICCMHRSEWTDISENVARNPSPYGKYIFNTHDQKQFLPKTGRTWIHVYSIHSLSSYQNFLIVSWLLSILCKILSYIQGGYHTCTHAQTHAQMSRNITKPTKYLCAQRRLRSAWASAQSDQSLRYPHEESLGPSLPNESAAKTLIRLGGCPGWSEYSLGTHSFCWFCHAAAQMDKKSKIE